MALNNTTSTPATERPDDVLAARIVERLVQAQMVPGDESAELARQLADGRIRTEDWSRLAERRLESRRRAGA